MNAPLRGSLRKACSSSLRPFAQLRLRNENLTQVVMHFFLVRIEAQRQSGTVLLPPETIRFVQGKPTSMGAELLDKSDASKHLVRFWHLAPRLPDPERAEWNHKYRNPF